MKRVVGSVTSKLNQPHETWGPPPLPSCVAWASDLFSLTLSRREEKILTVKMTARVFELLKLQAQHSALFPLSVITALCSEMCYSPFPDHRTDSCRSCWPTVTQLSDRFDSYQPKVKHGLLLPFNPTSRGWGTWYKKPSWIHCRIRHLFKYFSAQNPSCFCPPSLLNIFKSTLQGLVKISSSPRSLIASLRTKAKHYFSSWPQETIQPGCNHLSSFSYSLWSSYTGFFSVAYSHKTFAPQLRLPSTLFPPFSECKDLSSLGHHCISCTWHTQCLSGTHGLFYQKKE